MNRRALASAAILLALVSSTSFADDKSSSPDWVSIVNLIATPEKFHGRKVFLSAYVTIEFENMSLCMTEHPLSSRDCIWLNIDSRPMESNQDVSRWKALEGIWLKVNHQVISLHGTFDKDDTGHLDGWSGTIKNVTRVYGKDVSIDFTTEPPTVRVRGKGTPVQ